MCGVGLLLHGFSVYQEDGEIRGADPLADIGRHTRYEDHSE